MLEAAAPGAGETDLDVGPPIVELRCSSAAMRSLRLVVGIGTRVFVLVSHIQSKKSSQKADIPTHIVAK